MVVPYYQVDQQGVAFNMWYLGWLDEAKALGCAAVVTNYAVLDAASLAAIHGAGMRGLVYTVNDPAEARRLDSLGIDGIVTDAVDRFSPGHGVAD